MTSFMIIIIMIVIAITIVYYCYLAAGQDQWYHFGVGAPPILVYFCGDWDVHWGYDLDFDPWPFTKTILSMTHSCVYNHHYHI